MIKLGVTRERNPHENRVALTPKTAKALVNAGLSVGFEAGFAAHLGWEDAAYEQVGALPESTEQLRATADIHLRVRKPTVDEVKTMAAGSSLVCFLDPFGDSELLEALRAQRVRAVSLEMLPRSTYAQKMDALSSQANLAGYVAVMLAANHLPRVLPMMMTPAGTVSPAKVFVVGVGVAGLQAIATAKRLGARVEAYDVRPEVKEQVASLGAKFIELSGAQTGTTASGYAEAQTADQQAEQKAGMRSVCAGADVVITTAQLFGRPAPQLLDADMVAAMQPGSVIVDLAVESGGNVAGAKLDEVVDVGGVKIIGLANLPGRVAVHASELYAANLKNWVLEFYDPKAGTLQLDHDHPLLKACLLTDDGLIIHPQLQQNGAG